MSTANRPLQCKTQRGAASGALLAVTALVIVGAAYYFYPRDSGGTVNPEDGTGASQGTPETPSGKTAPKTGESGVANAGQDATEAGGANKGTVAGGAGKKVVLTRGQEQIMEWEGTCHDPAASDKDKLAAIAALRKTDKTGEQFVPLMTQILEDAKTDELAMGMILEMRKRKHEQFGTYLMDAMRKRQTQEVKIAAIRTLGAYMNEPSLKSLLKQYGEGAGSEIEHEIRAAIEGRKGHWDQGQ
jgi:hypothetical protein